MKAFWPVSLPLAVLCVGVWGLLHRGAFRSIGLYFEPPPRREVPLWGASELVLAFFVFLLAGPLVGVALAGRGGEASAAALNGAITCAAIIWIVSHVFGQPLTALGLRRSSLRNLWAVLVVSALIFVPLGVVATLWEELVTFLGHDASKQLVVEQLVDSFREGRTLEFSLKVVTAVVTAPITEELLFRGMLYGMLRRRWGFWGSAVASSIIFAAVHFNLFAVVPLFLVGMALAYVFERTGSLFYAVLYHALFNGVSIVGMVLLSS